MEKSNTNNFTELLNKTTPADFDGHTEFNNLTPEQKLMWLSQSAQFVVESRKNPD